MGDGVLSKGKNGKGETARRVLRLVAKGEPKQSHVWHSEAPLLHVPTATATLRAIARQWLCSRFASIVTRRAIARQWDRQIFFLHMQCMRAKWAMVCVSKGGDGKARHGTFILEKQYRFTSMFSPPSSSTIIIPTSGRRQISFKSAWVDACFISIRFAASVGFTLHSESRDFHACITQTPSTSM